MTIPLNKDEATATEKQNSSCLLLNQISELKDMEMIWRVGENNNPQWICHHKQTHLIYCLLLYCKKKKATVSVSM